MTREEAITKYIVPAIERTWNDKICKEILEALEQEPKIVPIAEIKFDDDMLHEIVEEAVKNIEIEPKWIPVSERLPEEYGEYLITWTTSQSKRPFIGISEGEVTSEYDHEHNRFKFEWLLEDYIKNYPDVKVIAWMPSPEPYKEVSE